MDDVRREMVVVGGEDPPLECWILWAVVGLMKRGSKAGEEVVVVVVLELVGYDMVGVFRDMMFWIFCGGRGDS